LSNKKLGLRPLTSDGNNNDGKGALRNEGKKICLLGCSNASAIRSLVGDGFLWFHPQHENYLG
jgi:hypothetical protein